MKGLILGMFYVLCYTGCVHLIWYSPDLPLQCHGDWKRQIISFLGIWILLLFLNAVLSLVFLKWYRGLSCGTNIVREKRSHTHMHMWRNITGTMSQIELAPLLSTNRCKPHHRLMKVFPLMAVWMRSDDY